MLLILLMLSFQNKKSESDYEKLLLGVWDNIDSSSLYEKLQFSKDGTLILGVAVDTIYIDKYLVENNNLIMVGNKVIGDQLFPIDTYRCHILKLTRDSLTLSSLKWKTGKYAFYKVAGDN